MRKSSMQLYLAIALLIAIVRPAAGALLTNGDFEAGSLAGWTVTDQASGSGSWFAAVPGTPTPLSGIPTSAAGGSPHGTTYAVSDQNDPGSHALRQSFTVGPSSSVILTWDMFINNSDGLPTGTGLNFQVSPTQVGRVDILSSIAGAFDVGAGVLDNCFLGGAPGGMPNNFATFSCNITTAVGGGGTFQLRFAETDNQGSFNMGIDNVSISATQAPEPATLVLLGLGLAGLGFIRRRKA
jgi:hypothetical protein